MFDFEFPLDAVPKERPLRGASTPPKTRAFEDIITQLSKEQWDGEPLTDLLGASLVFDKGRILVRLWKLPFEDSPTARGDIDNLVKSTFDGMQGIIYKNDSQICILNARKI